MGKTRMKTYGETLEFDFDILNEFQDDMTDDCELCCFLRTAIKPLARDKDDVVISFEVIDGENGLPAVFVRFGTYFVDGYDHYHGYCPVCKTIIHDIALWNEKGTKGEELYCPNCGTKWGE